MQQALFERETQIKRHAGLDPAYWIDTLKVEFWIQGQVRYDDKVRGCEHGFWVLGAEQSRFKNSVIFSNAKKTTRT